MTKCVDLSHTIADGVTTYKGLPAPIVCDYLSRVDSRKFYEAGTEFQIAKIEMVSNTGTYVDVPFHRFADGKDLAQFELRRFVDLPAIIARVDYRQTTAIDASYFQNLDVTGKAVLINTNWDEFWNTPAYFENHPFVTERAAEFLRDNGATLVGIDSHNIDDTNGNRRPTHTTLLAAEIVVCEHLTNLRELPDDGFTFTAAPPKFAGVGTFPVRAFARIA